MHGNPQQPNADEYTIGNKCVLVTGGVGFVGSHIAETLIKEGHAKVVVYDIFNSETSVSEEKKENAAILKKCAAMYAYNGSSLYIVRGDIRAIRRSSSKRSRSTT